MYSRAIRQRVQEGLSHPAKCFVYGAAVLPVEMVMEKGYLHRFGGGWGQPRSCTPGRPGLAGAARVAACYPPKRSIWHEGEGFFEPKRVF